MNENKKPNIITEEQWEKDLDAELQEYEVVTDGKPAEKTTSSNNNEDWEKDVDDLLDDSHDLK